MSSQLLLFCMRNANMRCAGKTLKVHGKCMLTFGCCDIFPLFFTLTHAYTHSLQEHTVYAIQAGITLPLLFLHLQTFKFECVARKYIKFHWRHLMFFAQCFVKDKLCTFIHIHPGTTTNYAIAHYGMPEMNIHVVSFKWPSAFDSLWTQLHWIMNGSLSAVIENYV